MQSIAVTPSHRSSIWSSLWERLTAPAPEAIAAGHSTPQVALLQARLSHGLSRRELLVAAGSAGRVEPRSDGLETLHWHDARGHTIAVTLRKGLVVRWEVAREQEA